MASISSWPQYVNSFQPEQNGDHFADDIFMYISLTENLKNVLGISLKLEGLIDK